MASRLQKLTPLYLASHSHDRHRRRATLTSQWKSYGYLGLPIAFMLLSTSVLAEDYRHADGVMVISGVWKQVEGVAYPVG